MSQASNLEVIIDYLSESEKKKLWAYITLLRSSIEEYDNIKKAEKEEK